MKIGPFGVLERTSDGLHDLLSLHWRNSITWRFVLTWHRFTPSCRTSFFYKHGKLIGFNLPVIGAARLQWQDNMWR